MPSITKAPVLFCFPGLSLEVERGHDQELPVWLLFHGILKGEKMDSALLSKGPLCLAGLRKLVKNGCARF